MTQLKKESEIFNSGDGYSIILEKFDVVKPMSKRIFWSQDMLHLVTNFYRFHFKFPKKTDELYVDGFKSGKVFIIAEVAPHKGSQHRRSMNKRTELPVFVKLFPEVTNYLRNKGFQYIAGTTHKKMARLAFKRLGFSANRTAAGDWSVKKKLGPLGKSTKKFLFKKPHLK